MTTLTRCCEHKVAGETSVQERSHAQIEGFWEMDVCGFQGLDFEGRSWTFAKRVAGGSFCRVRLDRALATIDWCLRFPETKVGHLTAAASDHGPILLLLQWTSTSRCRRGRKLFRYEIMWESHEDFPSMMMECHVGAELKKLNGELEHLKSAPKTISSNVLHLYSD
jgi:hypothetical protein